MYSGKFRRINLFNLAGGVATVNIILLGYNGWQRTFNSDCHTCRYVALLPVSDVAITVAGLFASLSIAILCFLPSIKYRLRYVTILLSGFCAGFASFLQISQAYFAGRLCSQCLIVSIGFYLMFCILLYHLVLRHLWLKVPQSVT